MRHRRDRLLRRARRSRRRACGAWRRALAHRGPDAEGFSIDARAAPSVGLAHRRLSIIDLSHEADQPIGNEDGTVLAMLNGEIYNFAELRAGAGGRATASASHGDTETIVHGYEDAGDAIVAALDGMFALALWDARRRRLLLARDPFGKKPLYYWTDGARASCSRPRSRRCWRRASRRVRRAEPARVPGLRLRAHAADAVPRHPQLPPASTHGRGRAGRVRAARLLGPALPARGRGAARRRSPKRPTACASGSIAAVRKRLMADVPLGVLLSGGVDSGAVAGAGGTASWPRRSTRSRSASKGPRSTTSARAAARMAATWAPSTTTRGGPQAAALMETLLHHHDEPFGDSSALPTYLVAREARQHVTVVLNGDGGDETFAGYERFRAELIANRVPDAAAPPAPPPRSCCPSGRQSYGTLRRLQRFAREVRAALPGADPRLAQLLRAARRCARWAGRARRPRRWWART